MEKVTTTEIREAINSALLELSKRFSFLEDYTVRRQIGDAIHEKVAQALREKLSRKEFDIAVIEEIIASEFEKLKTEMTDEHLKLAGVMGRRSGELTNEIRMAAHRILEEILSLKREERETQKEIEKTRDTIQKLEYMRYRL